MLTFDEFIDEFLTTTVPQFTWRVRRDGTVRTDANLCPLQAYWYATTGQPVGISVNGLVEAYEGVLTEPDVIAIIHLGDNRGTRHQDVRERVINAIMPYMA